MRRIGGDPGPDPRGPEAVLPEDLERQRLAILDQARALLSAPSLHWSVDKQLLQESIITPLEEAPETAARDGAAGIDLLRRQIDTFPQQLQMIEGQAVIQTAAHYLGQLDRLIPRYDNNPGLRGQYDRLVRAQTIIHSTGDALMEFQTQSQREMEAGRPPLDIDRPHRNYLELLPIFREIDNLEAELRPMQENVSQVNSLMADYIRENNVLPKAVIEKHGSPEKIIQEALRQGKDIDGIFRASATEYRAYELTRDMRARNHELFANQAAEAQSSEQKRGLNWLLLNLTGNAGTAALGQLLGIMAMNSVGMDPSHYPLTRGFIGAGISGAVGGLSARALMADDHVTTGYRLLERTQEYTQTPRSSRLETSEGEANLNNNTPYHALLRRYEELYQEGQYFGSSVEGQRLFERIALATSQHEFDMARETVARIEGETDVSYRARLLIALKEIQANGSLQAENSAIYRALNQQFGQWRNQDINTHAWQNALTWAAIGGVFSFHNPETPWSPTASSSPLALLTRVARRAHQTNRHRWNWMTRRENKLAAKEKQAVEFQDPAETTPEKLKEEPIRVLGPFDERMFYLDRKTFAGIDRKTQDLIDSVAAMSDREQQALRTQLECLVKSLYAHHGRYYFKTDETGRIRAYQLRPLSMKKSRVTTHPDPSNWPHLQEEIKLQGAEGINRGKLYVQEYKVDTLFSTDITGNNYQPMPDLQDEDFRLSGNLPTYLWVPIDKVPRAVDYDFVFDTQGTHNLIQATIEPGEDVSRIAYELTRQNLDLDRFKQRLVAQSYEGKPNVTKAINEAKE